MVFAMCMVAVDANIKPCLTKSLIDTATSTNSKDFWYLVSIFAVSQLMLMLSWTFSDFCAVKFSSDFRTHTASTLAQKVSRHSYSFFQNNFSGSIVAKISDAFNLIPTIIFTISHQFLHSAFTVIISVCLLAQVHILFSVGLFLWVLIFLGGILIGLKKVSPITKDYAQARSTAFGYLSDHLTNMLNVKLFAISSYEMDRFHKASINYVKKSQRQGYFLMNLYAIQGSIFSIYAISFVIFLVYLHSQKLITAGDFALVFMINFKIVDIMFEMSQNLRDFIPNWGAVDEALKLIEKAPEIQDAPNAPDLNVTQGQIIFDKVEFNYKSTKYLFNDTSVTIAPGQKVGLVGYSGGGKSTFVNLILRLYDVINGNILIDGQNIKDVTQDSLHENIGMIPQDPSLFHRSLFENIRYGKITASDDEVIKASKLANTHEFITKFPHGYESLVGDRGVKLSGGQRQRVAIARAFLKNAPILILDEATSQLDSVTENVIQNSLWQLMQGKTTIVIAHRLSTLLRMDRKLVFDEGKIIEDGTHQELLSKNTMYKTLWDAQIGGFLPDMKEEIL